MVVSFLSRSIIPIELVIIHARASSIWQHDTRQFGPQHALDSQSMDAWKSAPSEDSNPLAYYEIHFHRPVNVREMRVQFQGGFVGMDCIVFQKKFEKSHESKKCDDGQEWEELEELFLDPIESNDIQTFPVDEDMIPNESNDPCIALRIEFSKSTDFYGRIVIYSVEVWGIEFSDEK